ncbi:Chemotaxis regulator [Sandaracinus amylolyticus]|uniref:Chemotaxis regulator n=2 Tax=Sandaracinus amylolyticus TaxID=927083 RepID=A0A0F6W9I0_9BACT|nr:Chemotaxis regulator [Sandaracinus amylolyticus]
MVLIVDDHIDTAEMFAECLRLIGARSIVTSSVAQAEALLGMLQVDAVVTDYAMPGEDGLSLVRKIRASDGGDALPVVMVSAHDRDGNVAEGARALGADFVAKPVDGHRLIDVVRAALSDEARRRAERATDPAPEPLPVARELIELPPDDWKRDPRREE